MAKNQEEKFGLAFDSGLKLIRDAPGKKSPIHLLQVILSATHLPT